LPAIWAGVTAPVRTRDAHGCASATPVAWFGEHGVPAGQVLTDAVAVAKNYDRTTRDFDVDGPHVVTGPIHVGGAEPGDVLKVDVLTALPRVPYGVVSSRHGKGALPRLAGGAVPAGITEAEIMPPVATDGRATKVPTKYGNVSVFTPVRGGGEELVGALPRPGHEDVTFPLRPFMGMMGVAFADAGSLTDPLLNSIPPTLGGGNIDINLLGTGSTFYLPVFPTARCSTSATRTSRWATARSRSPRWRVRCARPTA
jgi:acetamidase/formamidase